MITCIYVNKVKSSVKQRLSPSCSYAVYQSRHHLHITYIRTDIFYWSINLLFIEPRVEKHTHTHTHIASLSNQLLWFSILTGFIYQLVFPRETLLSAEQPEQKPTHSQQLSHASAVCVCLCMCVCVCASVCGFLYSWHHKTGSSLYLYKWLFEG